MARLFGLETGDEIASEPDGGESVVFLQMTDLVRRYALFNPAATLTVKRPKAKPVCWKPTDTGWRHWLPNRPTSPHWYTPERLRTLVAAYLTRDREHGRIRTVREVVAEFAGLSATARQRAVTTAAGFSKGTSLEDLVVDGDVDVEPIARLLTAMQDASRAITPAALGVIGKDHLTARLKTAGVDTESIRYTKTVGVDDDGCPFVLEVAYGLHADRDDEHTHHREVIVGLNWAPALAVPIADLRSFLGAARVDDWDPVTMLVHIAHPRFEWLDRGKSEVAI